MNHESTESSDEKGGPHFAPAPFTNAEFFEVNDSLNAYLHHMMEVGQTDIEIRYNSLANTFSALAKVGYIINHGEKPIWVDEMKANVEAAIKKPKRITENGSKRLKP